MSSNFKYFDFKKGDTELYISYDTLQALQHNNKEVIDAYYKWKQAQLELERAIEKAGFSGK